MSWLKDFNDLSYPIKRIAICIIIIMPFWYLVTIVYSDYFANCKRIELPIIMAYCLTVSHFFITMASVQPFFERINNVPPKMHPDAPLALATFISISSISLFGFIWQILGWGYFSLVTSLYAIALFLLLLDMLLAELQSKKPKA